MGATLIYKEDLIHFAGSFLLTDDRIPIKDDDKDSENLGKGEFGEVFLGKYRDSVSFFFRFLYKFSNLKGAPNKIYRISKQFYLRFITIYCSY